MKYLDFLDETGRLSIPLIDHEVPEDPKPIAAVEIFFEFIDDLFDNSFWKSYYKNVKKNK